MQGWLTIKYKKPAMGEVSHPHRKIERVSKFDDASCKVTLSGYNNCVIAITREEMVSALIQDISLIVEEA